MIRISPSRRYTGSRLASSVITLVLFVLAPLATSAQNLSIDRPTITGHLTPGEQTTETFTIENTGRDTIHLTLSPRHDQIDSTAKAPDPRLQPITRTAKRGAARAPSLAELAREEDTITVVVTLLQPAQSTSETTGIHRQKQRLLDDLSGNDVRISRAMTGFPTVSLRVTPAGLNAVRSHPFVKRVSPNRHARPTLTESTKIVGAPEIWNRGYTGRGQTVVILDTGFDIAHPFVSGRVVEEACFSGGAGASLCPDSQRTAVGRGTASVRTNGHGTHIAGIVAGDGSYREIVPNGIAPEASIIAIQVFSKAPDGLRTAPEDYIAALQYVYRELRNRYDIAAINLSAATDDWHTTSHCVDHGAAPIIRQLREVDIATVIASGNAHEKYAVSSPGCIPEAITVAATGDGMITDFSNTSYLIDLLAPGQEISSSIPIGFGLIRGTSQAAAHVTGGIAAIASHRSTSSVRELRDMLIATGVRLRDVNNLRKPRIALDRAVDYTPWFTLDVSAYHRSLPPGATWTVPIQFDGNTVSDSGRTHGYTGAVEIASTDRTEPMQTVSLSLMPDSARYVSTQCEFIRGWNLTGLAVRPDTNAMSALFPSATPHSTYAWNNRYIRSDSAAVGRGYWIHFPEHTTTMTAGEQLYRVVWELQQGWNLVSAPSCGETRISRTDLEAGADIITDDSMYKWDSRRGAYRLVDELEAVRGYWVHALARGTVTIDCSPDRPVRSGVHEPSALRETDPGLPPPPPGEVTNRSPDNRPGGFKVQGNYPNPFNPSTSIRFELPEPANVTVTVVDMLGRTVRRIETASMSTGQHAVHIDAASLPGGIYIYRVTAQIGDHVNTASGTMTLVK